MDRGTRGPYRSRDFLAWAKQQPAPCAICRNKQGEELHHYGAHGMGQKGSDLIVAHLCRTCHGEVQGLTTGSPYRWIAAEKLPQLGDVLTDTVNLLAGYVQHLEASPDRARPPRCAGCGHLGADGCGACWPHLEPPIDCAREELLAWAVENLIDPAGLQFDGRENQIAWLLAWANRRAGNLLERLVDALQQVTAEAADADMDQELAAGVVVEGRHQKLLARCAKRIRDMGCTAADALRRAGFKVLP
jgi:hypothetical protein